METLVTVITWIVLVLVFIASWKVLGFICDWCNALLTAIKGIELYLKTIADRRTP